MDKEKIVFKEMDESMHKAVDALIHDFSRIKTGRASLSLLDDIRIDYYGQRVPINQVATLSVPESRLILIQPWDVKTIGSIEKAIRQSDLGLNPVNDGRVIRLPIPPLTEERRKELIKVARKMTEEARVTVRNVRRDTNETLKQLEKEKEVSEDGYRKLHEKVQTITDEYIEKINKVLEAKEKEILEV